MRAVKLVGSVVEMPVGYSDSAVRTSSSLEPGGVGGWWDIGGVAFVLSGLSSGSKFTNGS